MYTNSCSYHPDWMAYINRALYSFPFFCCLLTFPFKDSAAYVVLKYFLILKVVDYGINFTIKNFIANNLYGLTKENTGTYKTNVQNIYLECTSGVRIDFHASAYHSFKHLFILHNKISKHANKRCWWLQFYRKYIDT